MTVRKTFDADLNLLKEKVVHMASLAEQSFLDALSSLKQQDLVLAEQLIERDKEINIMEEDIDELVVRLISTQQPVASDLRKIVATLKMASSIERIGDFSVDIAKATKRIGADNLVTKLVELPIMIEIVQEMLKKAISAYVYGNVSLAEELADMDDQVDKLYATIHHNLLELLDLMPDKKAECIQLSFVLRYIERIGDHATNLAEAIIYIVSGKRVDLNP